MKTATMKQQERFISCLLDEPKARNLHHEATIATKKNILLAAMECFSKKGYQNTTAREIAKNAGVTVGAVYHHFQDKKEILKKLSRAWQVQSLQNLRTAMEDNEDFFDAVGAAFQTQFRMLTEDTPLRGIVREYMSMAMVVPDVNKMHMRIDLEYREIADAELARRHPNLPARKRASLIQALFFAAEGMITGLVVESPLARNAERTLQDLIEALRKTVNEWERPASKSRSTTRKTKSKSFRKKS